MFCQFRSLGSLHSNCRGAQSGQGGSGELHDDWCNRGLNKKATVCVWYVLGLPSFEGEGWNASCHTFSALSARTLLLSAADVKVHLLSCHVACRNIEPMMALWNEGCGVCQLLCRRIKEEKKKKICSVRMAFDLLECHYWFMLEVTKFSSDKKQPT